jgi:soluble lytic murein transglycosylase
VLAVAWLWWEQRVESRYNKEIKSAARRYGLEPALVKAVVWRESKFNPLARGTQGELGLMQLQSNAAQEWADAERIETFVHEHCLDPRTNTLAGAFYLSKLLKRYAHTDNPVPYALADYNAGRGNVLKWNTGTAATNSSAFLEQVGFPATQKYVGSVMRRHRLYRLLARIGLD